MDVGDEVTLSAYPSWGICVITRVSNDGPETIYSIRRSECEGITLLMGLRSADLEPVVPPPPAPPEA